MPIVLLMLQSGSGHTTSSHLVEGGEQGKTVDVPVVVIPKETMVKKLMKGKAVVAAAISVDDKAKGSPVKKKFLKRKMKEVLVLVGSSEDSKHS